jgi:hypothetical protein
MEEPDEVCAWAHDETLVRERSLQRAGPADTIARLQHEHALAGSSEIRGRREAVVTRPDNDRVPALGVDPCTHDQARNSVMA